MIHPDVLPGKLDVRGGTQGLRHGGRRGCRLGGGADPRSGRPRRTEATAGKPGSGARILCKDRGCLHEFWGKGVVNFVERLSQTCSLCLRGLPEVSIHCSTFVFNLLRSRPTAATAAPKARPTTPTPAIPTPHRASCPTHGRPRMDPWGPGASAQQPEGPQFFHPPCRCPLRAASGGPRRPARRVSDAPPSRRNPSD